MAVEEDSAYSQAKRTSLYISNSCYTHTMFGSRTISLELIELLCVVQKREQRLRSPTTEQRGDRAKQTYIYNSRFTVATRVCASTTLKAFSSGNLVLDSMASFSCISRFFFLTMICMCKSAEGASGLARFYIARRQRCRDAAVDRQTFDRSPPADARFVVRCLLGASLWSASLSFLPTDADACLSAPSISSR